MHSFSSSFAPCMPISANVVGPFPGCRCGALGGARESSGGPPACGPGEVTPPGAGPLAARCPGGRPGCRAYGGDCVLAGGEEPPDGAEPVSTSVYRCWLENCLGFWPGGAAGGIRGLVFVEGLFSGIVDIDWFRAGTGGPCTTGRVAEFLLITSTTRWPSSIDGRALGILPSALARSERCLAWVRFRTSLSSVM